MTSSSSTQVNISFDDPDSDIENGTIGSSSGSRDEDLTNSNGVKAKMASSNKMKTGETYKDEPSTFIDKTTKGDGHSLDRSHSLDAANSPYYMAFRMPRDHSDIVANDARSEVSARSNRSNYDFVMDNYVEYTVDTKIPRFRRKDENKLLAAIHSSHWAVLSLVVAGSCFLTYSISNYSPFLRADLSQAIVITTILATLPELAASTGTGAFVGMANLEAVPKYEWLSLLAFNTAAIWMIIHHYKILVGCGGRLGTCAFISMNVTLAIFVMPSGAVPWSLYVDTSQLWSERLELVPSILSVVACTFLSAVGGAVRINSKMPLNPIQAPTTIALLCMLILEPTGFKYTEQVDAGLAVGSFVAMASEQFLPSTLDFAAAGFLAGLWILFLDPFFLGFGGKKGFTSFCGFATYMAISKLAKRNRAIRETK